MNALGAIERSLAVASRDEAVVRVNTWRGQAIECFAQAECEVSEALLAMQDLPSGRRGPELPHLFGQRFGTLQGAVEPDGDFAAEGGRAAAALDAFAPHLPLRRFLCHGRATVRLDVNGRWRVVLKFVCFSAKGVERGTRTISECEAETILAELAASTKALGPALQSLRDRIRRREMAVS